VQHLDHADTTTAPDQPTCPSHKHRDGAPVWCGECRADIADALSGLPEQYRRLVAVQGRRTPPSSGRGGTMVDAPSPSPEFDHADDILRWVHGWARAWADYRGIDSSLWSAPTHLRGHRHVADYVATLQRHHRRLDLLGSPLALDLGREVRSLAASTRSLLGDAKRAPVIGICAGCGTSSLWREAGGTVTCGWCPRTMTDDEYAGHRAWLAASAGRGSVAA